MDAAAILALIGSVALLAGVIGGGIEAKEIKIPPLPRWSRIASSQVGLSFISIAVLLTLKDADSPKPTPTPTATATTQIAEKAADTATPASDVVLTLNPEAIRGCTVEINGFARYNVEGPMTFDWGDQNFSKGYFTQTHTYASSGMYTVTVTTPDQILSRSLSFAVECIEPTATVEPSSTPENTPAASSASWSLAFKNANINRHGMPVVYDLNRGVAVLFSGNSPDGVLADTWEFDGKNWLQVVTEHTPPGAKMVWHGI